jgi:hypothetical protein
MLSVENKNDGIMRSYTGHGMIEKHPAGLTIAGVMGHELGHVNEAKNLALASGREVISQNIQINVEFEGSRLVATSGRATTVTAARVDAASSYKNTMANYELEKNLNASAAQPIKNISQLKQPDSALRSSSGSVDDTADFKAVELSSILSQQKQKLESKIQQLSVLQAAGFNLSREAPAAPGAGAALQAGKTPGSPEDFFSLNGAPQERSASPAEDSQRRQATEKLVRIREQIAKIDNIIASLKIAKSVKMLGNILQAVISASGMSADITIPAGGGDSLSSTVSYARGPLNRKSAFENMISMIEDSLRGMVINLSA